MSHTRMSQVTHTNEDSQFQRLRDSFQLACLLTHIDCLVEIPKKEKNVIS